MRRLYRHLPALVNTLSTRLSLDLPFLSQTCISLAYKRHGLELLLAALLPLLLRDPRRWSYYQAWLTDDLEALHLDRVGNTFTVCIVDADVWILAHQRTKLFWRT